MQVKIIKDEKSPLLLRKEIKAEITFDKATPSNAELAKYIASQLKVDEKLVVVKNIFTRFGETVADSLIYVYDSAEQKDKIEPRNKKAEAKKAEAEKKAAEAAPAPAEKPAEEKKQAPKEEKPAENKEEKK